MDGNKDECLRIMGKDGDQKLLATYSEEEISIIREIKMKRNYYEILGLERSCSVEDMKTAYRKLSLKVHPDKNRAPGAEEAFQAVSKAYHCLSNQNSRNNYDAQQQQPQGKPPSPTATQHDVEVYDAQQGASRNRSPPAQQGASRNRSPPAQQGASRTRSPPAKKDKPGEELHPAIGLICLIFFMYKFGNWLCTLE